MLLPKPLGAHPYRIAHCVRAQQCVTESLHGGKKDANAKGLPMARSALPFSSSMLVGGPAAGVLRCAHGPNSHSSAAQLSRKHAMQAIGCMRTEESLEESCVSAKNAVVAATAFSARVRMRSTADLAHLMI